MKSLVENYPDDAKEFCRLFNQWIGSYVPESKLVRPNMDIYVFHRLRYRRVPSHSHQFFEIILVRNGMCQNFVQGGEKFVLNKGDVCFFPPYMEHDVRVDNHHSIVQSIAVRTSTFDKAFQSIQESNDIISLFFQHALHPSGERTPILLCKTQCEEQIYNLVDKMVDEQNRYDNFSSAAINSIFVLFIVQIFRLHRFDFKTNDNSLKRNENANIIDILQYIQDNYKTITLGKAAETFHYSVAYFSRKIKSCTGMNFTEIIRMLKLQEAANLLREGESISTVVDKIGYNDYSHFFRIFKKQYGMSPKEYKAVQNRTSLFVDE